MPEETMRVIIDFQYSIEIFYKITTELIKVVVDKLSIFY